MTNKTSKWVRHSYPVWARRFANRYQSHIQDASAAQRPMVSPNRHASRLWSSLPTRRLIRFSRRFRTSWSWNVCLSYKWLQRLHLQARWVIFCLRRREADFLSTKFLEATTDSSSSGSCRRLGRTYGLKCRIISNRTIISVGAQSHAQ